MEQRKALRKPYRVIDRWHVLQNLREAVERFLNRIQMDQNRPAVGISPRQKRTRSEQTRTQAARQRRLALYHQVVEQSRQGGSILGIARQFKISRQTVRTYVQAPSFPEWQKAGRARSAIDAYRPSLSRRWREGCHLTTQLWQELQTQGFTGSWMMVYLWVEVVSQSSVNGF